MFTVNLAQISTTQYASVGYYIRVREDASGMYWDENTSVLKPLANAQPNIALTESPAGSGNWTVTRDFSGLPDGFYTITAFESTQNLKAASDMHVLLKGGETAETSAVTEVALNHHTGGLDNLTYKTPDGIGIAGATVRVYTSANWNAQALSNPTGVTSTDSSGRWMAPVFVQSGQTYYIQFQLAGIYGPDVASVTV